MGKKMEMDPVVETALYHICLVLNYVLTGEAARVEKILERCGLPENNPINRAVVLVPALRVRAGPGVGFPVVGRLNGGVEVLVLEKVTLEEAAWMKIGEDRWAAMIFRGERYAAELAD